MTKRLNRKQIAEITGVPHSFVINILDGCPYNDGGPGIGYLYDANPAAMRIADYCLDQAQALQEKSNRLISCATRALELIEEDEQ